MAYMHHEGKQPVSFAFEVDRNGNGHWEPLERIVAKAGESVHIEFDSREKGEWIRVRTDKNTKGTVHFSYTDLSRFQENMDPLFEGLAMMGEGPSTGGLLYGLGNNRRALGILAGGIENNSFL